MLGMTSIREFDSLTPNELKALLEGAELRILDERRLVRTMLSQNIFRTVMMDTENNALSNFNDEVDADIKKHEEDIKNRYSHKKASDTAVEKANLFARFFGRKN